MSIAIPPQQVSYFFFFGPLAAAAQISRSAEDERHVEKALKKVLCPLNKTLLVWLFDYLLGKYMED